jgi:Stigma-specific protein, Stig1
MKNLISYVAALGAALSFTTACGGNSQLSSTTTSDAGDTVDGASVGDSGPGIPFSSDGQAPPICVSGTVCKGTCVDLTQDPGNCGACADDCTGGSCLNGLCMLASGQAYPGAIVVGRDSVYFGTSAQSQDALMKVPLAGGAPSVVAPEAAFALAVDESSVYWSTGGAIRTLPVAGGAAISLATTGGGVYAIALDQTNLYFSESYGGGLVERVTLDGGALTPLAPAQSLPLGIAVSGGNAYWVDAPIGDGGGAVMSAPTAGGTPVVVAAAPSTPLGGVPAVVTDGANVYWIASSADSGGGGDILRAPCTGGDASLFQTANALALAIDATNLYWADGTNAIFAAPLGGGAVVTIAIGQDGPLGIAVDSTDVYWTSASAGAVMKAPK